MLSGKIVLGKNIALDKGKIAILFGKLFFDIINNFIQKTYYIQYDKLYLFFKL